jgi:hypothetical protein
MRIPVYDEPQVAPEQGSAPRESFSPLQPLGDGLQRAGAGLDQVGQQLRVAHEKAVAAAATDAETQFETKADLAFNGTPDGQTPGLLSLKGQDAVKQSVPVLQSLEQERQRIASTLKSDAARDYYLRSTAQSMLHRKALAERYVGEQVRTYQVETAQARVATGLRAIASAPGDDFFAGDQVASMAAATLGQLHGAPKEVQDQAIASIKAQAAQTRIQALLAPRADGSAPDFERAQKVLDGAREVLGADGISQYEKQIASTREAVQSDHQARSILAGAQLPGYQWVDETKALAAVNALPAGKQKDEIQQRVEHQLSLNQRLKEKNGEDLLNQAQSVYAQSGDPNDARLAPIKAQMLDPANGAAGKWVQFENSIRAQQRSSRYADAEDRRTQADADRKALFDFHALPPDEQVKVDVDNDPRYADASPLGHAAVKAAQRQVLNLASKAGLEPESEFKDHLRTVAENAGFAGNKPMVSQFYGAMGAWRAQQMLQNNKPPTREEVERQIQLEITKGSTGSLWSHLVSNRYRFQFAPDEKFVPAGGAAPASEAAPVQTSARTTLPGPTQRAPENLDDEADGEPGVPALDRALILQAFSKANRPAPSEEQLRAIYVKRRGSK